MQTIHLNAAGTVLFVRDDMESGEWTQEENTMNATYPYVTGKELQRGQQIAFRDPATNNLEFFEIRNVQTIEPEHYQQIEAESIALSELSDEHIGSKEYYNIPPQAALSDILTGTLWSVGNVSVGDLVEQASIRTQISALGLNGNVDLTSRPIVYQDAMKNAGYSDFTGDYATLYSMTYKDKTSSNLTYTVLVTPIKQDGTVYSQSRIDSYVEDMFARATNRASFKAADTDGMLIYVSGQGDHITEVDTLAGTCHDLSEAWEDCIDDVGSSGKVSRGNVWQAVQVIKENWNVYVTPRVTVNSAGSITGRYLDISEAKGTWRGLRLSIEKNMPDITVTYDDRDTITAMYGYGGNMDIAKASGDETKECTFADVVWTATADHPAKPAGQTYIEDPSKTALYGRNGRPRFGYYQNSDITDPETLLIKTWEALKITSSPKISISGTTVDLRRLGYHDEPLRLHDLVLVEVKETGELLQKEIIKLTVDLIDPTANRPEIGDYIPNIIYYQQKTNEDATGGGGGGGRGKTKVENEDSLTYAEWLKSKDAIGMVVGMKNGGWTVEAGRIVLSINEQDASSRILLQADAIDIDGIVTALEAYDISCGGLHVEGATDFLKGLYTEEWVVAESYISAGTYVEAGTGFMVVGNNHKATWQTDTVVTAVGVTLPSISRSSSRYFLYASSSGSTTPANTQTGRVITAYTEGSVSPTTKTIYYLGHA